MVHDMQASNLCGRYTCRRSTHHDRHPVCIVGKPHLDCMAGILYVHVSRQSSSAAVCMTCRYGTHLVCMAGISLYGGYPVCMVGIYLYSRYPVCMVGTWLCSLHGRHLISHTVVWQASCL